MARRIGAQVSTAAMVPHDLSELVEDVREELRMNRSKFIAIAMAMAVDRYRENREAFDAECGEYERNSRMPLNG